MNTASGMLILLMNNGAFKIPYHFLFGHDVASQFLADNSYEMKLFKINKTLDWFAFFCETVKGE